MSKLYDSLRAVKAGKMYSIVPNTSFDDVTTIQESWESISNYDMRYTIEYKVGVTFETKVYINPDMKGATTDAVKNAKESIIRAVYGEFFDPINRIRISLYNNDIEKAKKQLDDLADLIFT